MNSQESDICRRCVVLTFISHPISKRTRQNKKPRRKMWIGFGDLANESSHYERISSNGEIISKHWRALKFIRSNVFQRPYGRAGRKLETISVNPGKTKPALTDLSMQHTTCGTYQKQYLRDIFCTKYTPNFCEHWVKLIQMSSPATNVNKWNGGVAKQATTTKCQCAQY